jgi:hypothetical protein
VSLEETLINTLRARPNLPAAQLRDALGVSPATLMRAVRAAGAGVIAIGQARRTAYAARRPLRGSEAALPVFQVDAQGGYSQLGAMDLAYPDGSVLRFTQPCPWPLDDSMRDGWFEGVPYFMQDLRPDGFLGRQFARAHAQVLQFSENPQEWSDDDVLYAISLLGADPIGNIIVGEPALRLWLDRVQQPPQCLQEGEVAAAYVEHARFAMSHGVPGSSAGGQFPKFTALRDINGTPAHVLVKFSGSDGSPSTQRWSDLLVCEHLAVCTIERELGVQAAQTRIVQAGNRTFLEAERFDRHGVYGRSALCSWAAINYGWFGLAGRPWTEGAAKLRERGLVDAEAQQAIERMWHFGRLIGNTDMHDGNLSFQQRASAAGPALRLAPAYDMLPMLYAPQRGVELPPAAFRPQLPLPADRETWQQAAQAAAQFWASAAADSRISPAFVDICAGNLRTLQQTMQISSGLMTAPPQPQAGGAVTLEDDEEEAEIKNGVEL